jgi:hypothetical protein
MSGAVASSAGKDFDREFRQRHVFQRPSSCRRRSGRNDQASECGGLVAIFAGEITAAADKRRASP